MEQILKSFGRLSHMITCFIHVPVLTCICLHGEHVSTCIRLLGIHSVVRGLEAMNGYSVDTGKELVKVQPWTFCLPHQLH